MQSHLPCLLESWLSLWAGSASYPFVPNVTVRFSGVEKGCIGKKWVESKKKKKKKKKTLGNNYSPDKIYTFMSSLNRFFPRMVMKLTFFIEIIDRNNCSKLSIKVPVFYAALSAYKVKWHSDVILLSLILTFRALNAF